MDKYDLKTYVTGCDSIPEHACFGGSLNSNASYSNDGFSEGGFTIIELMVVTAIAAAVTILAFYYLMQEHSDSRQEAYVIESAHRFVGYSEAIRSHLVSNLDAIPAESRYQLGYGVLSPIDMPADFGPCPDGINFACSMWGNYMRSWGIKDDEDVFRAVIVWRSMFDASEAIRTDLAVDDESAGATYEYIAKWVAQIAEKEFGLVAGYLPANSQTATLVNNRQTVDISDYEIVTRDFARPVVFYGWPELGQLPSGQNNTNSGSGNNSECRVAFATYGGSSGWNSGQCNISWNEEAAIQACYPSGQYGYVLSIGRDGSTMTVGGYTRQAASNRTPDGSCQHNCTDAYQDVWTYGTLSLNSSRVWDGVCEGRYYSDNSGTTSPRLYASPPFPGPEITHSYCCRDLEP